MERLLEEISKKPLDVEGYAEQVLNQVEIRELL